MRGLVVTLLSGDLQVLKSSSIRRSSLFTGEKGLWLCHTVDFTFSNRRLFQAFSRLMKGHRCCFLLVVPRRVLLFLRIHPPRLHRGMAPVRCKMLQPRSSRASLRHSIAPPCHNKAPLRRNMASLRHNTLRLRHNRRAIYFYRQRRRISSSGARITRIVFYIHRRRMPPRRRVSRHRHLPKLRRQDQGVASSPSQPDCSF